MSMHEKNIDKTDCEKIFIAHMTKRINDQNILKAATNK